MRADLWENCMHLRAMDRQLAWALVTNDGEIVRITDRIDPSEGQQ